MPQKPLRMYRLKLWYGLLGIIEKEAVTLLSPGVSHTHTTTAPWSLFTVAGRLSPANTNSQCIHCYCYMTNYHKFSG